MSSSLGYDDWYPYGTLDGQTPPITEAVNSASLMGVLIITAAGMQVPVELLYPVKVILLLVDLWRLRIPPM